MKLSGLFFGGTLTPLIWMVGITIFLSISTGKRPLLIMAGYFFTFIQFALLVVYITFLSKILDPSNTSELLYDEDVYGNTYTSIISINWVFFLLFSALVIQHGHSVSKTIMVTLIIFGILNTGRLIIETVLSFKGLTLGLGTYLYLLFFFTDFASAVSLYMSTLYWKDLTYNKPGHYP
jgi:hypothetical protein